MIASAVHSTRAASGRLDASTRLPPWRWAAASAASAARTSAGVSAPSARSWAMPALKEAWTEVRSGPSHRLLAEALEQLGHPLHAVVGLHAERRHQEPPRRHVRDDVLVAECPAQASAEQRRQPFGGLVVVLGSDGAKVIHLRHQHRQGVAVAARDADHAFDDRHDGANLRQTRGRVEIGGQALGAAALDPVARRCRRAVRRWPPPARSRPRRRRPPAAPRRTWHRR